MRRILIDFLESILLRLTNGEMVRTVRIEASNIIEHNKFLNLSNRLPLMNNDIVEFESGNAYIVQSKKQKNEPWLAQAVSLKKYCIKDPEKTYSVCFKFNSLRELNFYIEQRQFLIKEILKNEMNPLHYERTIEESLEEAFTINDIWNSRHRSS